MRDLRLLEPFRRRTQDVVDLWGWVGDNTCGAFDIPSPTDKRLLLVIASSGQGWEHVSVSRKNRCPNWPEMEHVLDGFALPAETWMQLRAPIGVSINSNPYCLHWWRPIEGEIPHPPNNFAGPMKKPGQTKL